MNPNNTTGTLTQGQNFYQNGQNVGTVQFDTATGRRLNFGETTNSDPFVAKMRAAGLNDSVINLYLKNYSGTRPNFNPNLPAPVTEPMTPSSLKETVNPFVLPGTQFNTASSELGATTQGFLQSSLDQRASEAKAISDTSRADLDATIKRILDVQTSQGRMEEEAGIGQKAQRVNDITNQLEAEQRALMKQREDIFSAPGVTREQAQQQYSEIERRSLSKQADLGIMQSAANRDYETASNLITRKIALQLEPLKTLLDYQKTVYSENKDSFDKADERKFQNLIRDNERLFDLQKEEYQNVHSIALEAAKNGADQTTLQRILSSKSSNEAISAGYRFISDPLDREYKIAQIQSINADIRKKNSEAGLGIPLITNPEAVQYQGALNVILGSSNFTKEQKASLINAVNNGEDPFAVIKNQAKNAMGQTLATSLDKYETAKAQLESIDSLLVQYYVNGGKTNIFSGNIEKTINKLGAITDPKMVEIATNIASALQIYRNAVSGTAYSVQEGKDIASIFPGINKSEGLNKAILSGRMKAFETTIDQSYRNTLGSTYDKLKKSQKGNISPYVQNPNFYSNMNNADFFNSLGTFGTTTSSNNNSSLFGNVGSGYIPFRFN